jgi:hypothetical protein
MFQYRTYYARWWLADQLSNLKRRLKEKARYLVYGPRPSPPPPTKEETEALQQLIQALEAGGYENAPGDLVKGSALQVEDLSPVMQNVTFVGPPERLPGETADSFWARSRWFTSNVWGRGRISIVYVVDGLNEMPTPVFYTFIPKFVQAHVLKTRWRPQKRPVDS